MGETNETGVPVERLGVSAYTVPTDSPESDGTLKWDSTTMVVVEAAGGGERGLGHTYRGLANGRDGFGATNLLNGGFIRALRGANRRGVPSWQGKTTERKRVPVLPVGQPRTRAL